METAYIQLRDDLQAEQEDIQTQINANTAGANRATDFIVFVLTFAIPASAVLIYRMIGKRAVREYQVKADLEIEAERARRSCQGRVHRRALSRAPDSTDLDLRIRRDPHR